MCVFSIHTMHYTDQQLLIMQKCAFIYAACTYQPFIRTKNHLLCSPAQFTILISISEVNNNKSTSGNRNLCARPVYRYTTLYNMYKLRRGWGEFVCHAFNLRSAYKPERIFSNNRSLYCMWNLIFAPVLYQARGISANRKI